MLKLISTFKKQVIAGFILGIFFSISGLVIYNDLSIKILQYIFDTTDYYNNFDQADFYPVFGVSGLPFPSKAACNYLSISQGVLLGPACDSDSIFGEFSIFLNIIFWIMVLGIFKYLSYSRAEKH